MSQPLVYIDTSGFADLLTLTSIEVSGAGAEFGPRRREMPRVR